MTALERVGLTELEHPEAETFTIGLYASPYGDRVSTERDPNSPAVDTRIDVSKEKLARRFLPGSS